MTSLHLDKGAKAACLSSCPNRHGPGTYSLQSGGPRRCRSERSRPAGISWGQVRWRRLLRLASAAGVRAERGLCPRQTGRLPRMWCTVERALRQSRCVLFSHGTEVGVEALVIARPVQANNLELPTPCEVRDLLQGDATGLLWRSPMILDRYLPT